MTFDRDTASSDALLTDLYLDGILSGAALGVASRGGASDPEGPLEPAIRRAADRLHRDLVRVHPSFRFEERLATRLAEAAGAMRVAVAAGAEGGRVVAFPARGAADEDADLLDVSRRDLIGGPGATGVAEALTDRLAADAAGRRVAGRPLLIGGALTSAALSLAGAAFVAWRLGRPHRGATPMARAARAVRDARIAAALESAGAGVRSATRRLD